MKYKEKEIHFKGRKNSLKVNEEFINSTLDSLRQLKLSSRLENKSYLIMLFTTLVNLKIKFSFQKYISDFKREFIKIKIPFLDIHFTKIHQGQTIKDEEISLIQEKRRRTSLVNRNFKEIKTDETKEKFIQFSIDYENMIFLRKDQNSLQKIFNFLIINYLNLKDFRFCGNLKAKLKLINYLMNKLSRSNNSKERLVARIMLHFFQNIEDFDLNLNFDDIDKILDYMDNTESNRYLIFSFKFWKTFGNLKKLRNSSIISRIYYYQIAKNDLNYLQKEVFSKMHIGFTKVIEIFYIINDPLDFKKKEIIKQYIKETKENLNLKVKYQKIIEIFFMLELNEDIDENLENLFGIFENDEFSYLISIMAIRNLKKKEFLDIMKLNNLISITLNNINTKNFELEILLKSILNSTLRNEILNDNQIFRQKLFINSISNYYIFQYLDYWQEFSKSRLSLKYLNLCEKLLDWTYKLEDSNEKSILIIKIRVTYSKLLFSNYYLISSINEIVKLENEIPQTEEFSIERSQIREIKSKLEHCERCFKKERNDNEKNKFAFPFSNFFQVNDESEILKTNDNFAFVIRQLSEEKCSLPLLINELEQYTERIEYWIIKWLYYYKLTEKKPLVLIQKEKIFIDTIHPYSIMKDIIRIKDQLVSFKYQYNTLSLLEILKFFKIDYGLNISKDDCINIIQFKSYKIKSISKCLEFAKNCIENNNVSIINYIFLINLAKSIINFYENLNIDQGNLFIEFNKIKFGFIEILDICSLEYVKGKGYWIYAFFLKLFDNSSFKKFLEKSKSSLSKSGMLSKFCNKIYYTKALKIFKELEIS